MRKCEHCGKEVTSKHNHVVYCSHKCANVATAKSRTKRVEITCLNCSKVFTETPSAIKYRGEIKFCSQKCHGQHRVKTGGKWTILECDFCHKEFSKLNIRLRKLNFCSVGCRKKHSRMYPLKRGGFWYENGYKVIYTGKGRGIKEHINIMQESIGRELKKNEVVHHINGIRDDNRLENLQIMTNAEHSRLHRLKDIENGIPCIKRSGD